MNGKVKMTKVELAKIIMIYEFVYMTENPNKVSQEVRSKLKKKLRHILTNQEELYNEAKELRKKAYEDAWYSLFNKGEEAYVSLGNFMAKVYNSMDKQKLIGHKLMKRLFDSYHHCDSDKKLTEQQKIEMETNSYRLAKRFLEELGETVESPLTRMRLNIKNNLIIEGKIT